MGKKQNWNILKQNCKLLLMLFFFFGILLSTTPSKRCSPPYFLTLVQPLNNSVMNRWWHFLPHKDAIGAEVLKILMNFKKYWGYLPALFILNFWPFKYLHNKTALKQMKWWVCVSVWWWYFSHTRAVKKMPINPSDIVCKILDKFYTDL